MTRHRSGSHRVYLGPQIDFAFPRFAISVFQWIVVVLGAVGAVAVMVSALHATPAVHALDGLLGGFLAAAAVMACAGVAYAMLAGVLAVFQIADDTRELLLLEAADDHEGRAQ